MEKRKRHTKTILLALLVIDILLRLWMLLLLHCIISKPPANENKSLRRLNNLTRKLNQTEVITSYGETIQDQKGNWIIEDASNPASGTEFYITHKQRDK